MRFAIRRLRNSPAFSAVAIVTIALGIGANTAIFAFVKGMLLSPLPYPDADRIVRVLEKLPNGTPNAISTLNYLDWAKQNYVFDLMAAEAGWTATLTGGDEPVVIRGARVSARYFDIFGVKPARGRTFLPDEDQPGRDRVVLLSHALWESRFGSDTGILEHSITVNDEPYLVIGILPKGGPFDRTQAQIFTPLAFEPSNLTRDFRWLAASAKLKPDVTIRQAQSAMNIVADRLATTYPDTNKGYGIAVDRLSDVVIGEGQRAAVTVLFVATLAVLLIGCANLANLAMARGIAREREIAVRAALGAGRGRLVGQFLTEHIVISVCGGIAGLAVGYAMMKWIQTLIPATSLPPAVSVVIDAPVLLFAFVLSVLAGVLIGVAPSLHATKPDFVSTLKEGGRGASTGIGVRRVRRALIVAEVALAFVLLSASGVLIRSLFNLLHINPGFDATNVLAAGLPVNQKQHSDPAELNAYLARIGAAIQAVPGIRTTAITSALPLEGWGFGTRYAIGDRPTEWINRRLAFFKIVSPSYFDALGIRLSTGRLLSGKDTQGSPRVAVINETLARREFPDVNPIGHHILTPEITAGRTALEQDVSWEIVGVVAGEKVTGIGDPVSAGLYVSNQQSPTYNVNLIVRADVPPESLEKAIRSAIGSVNRGQAISDVRTLEQIVQQSMLGNRIVGTLFTAFAAIALVLASVGIYGVISYTASQRTHELGIRAALGASAASLRGLVFWDGMSLTLLGLAIGFAGTYATSRLLSRMLYGVGGNDPLTIGIVAGVLGGVAGLACFLPARRITKADAMEVLRSS